MINLNNSFPNVCNKTETNINFSLRSIKYSENIYIFDGKLSTSQKLYIWAKEKNYLKWFITMDTYKDYYIGFYILLMDNDNINNIILSHENLLNIDISFLGNYKKILNVIYVKIE